MIIHMKGMQLFYTPEVKQLIEDFSYCFDVKITFFSTDMYEYLVGYHTRSSDFCALMQNGLNARYRCIQQDKLMCSRCHDDGRIQIYVCHAGLVEVIIPIFIEGEIAAYAFLGQFRSSDDLPEKLLEEWRGASLDEEELSRSFLDRPLYTGEKLEKMIRLFSQNLELLLSSRALKVFHPSITEEVLSYIDHHIGDKIDISEVASFLSKSESAVSHAVKKELGISFKELLITRKISAFEQIAVLSPGIQIKDAALQVGYDDALYFSRLYRQKRGCTPSDFVKTLSGEGKLHLQKL